MSEGEVQGLSDSRSRAASWGGQRSASAEVEDDVFSWDEELSMPSFLKGSVDFSRLSLSEKLELGFKSSGSLLKEVLLDFSPFLSRVLIGSHGQELVLEGLSCQKSDSIVELVMLLCSQEWQNSLQRLACLTLLIVKLMVKAKWAQGFFPVTSKSNLFSFSIFPDTGEWPLWSSSTKADFCRMPCANVLS